MNYKAGYELVTARASRAESLLGPIIIPRSTVTVTAPRIHYCPRRNTRDK